MNANQDNKLVLTCKTVEWIVNHTTVSTFDPVKFTGYQRAIDPKHCDKIVGYLQESFFLPSAIICACDEQFNDNIDLRIVDGQHRVEALKKVREEYPQRYSVIKDYELPVVVLEQVPQNVEVDTFININKKAKKVDTSLAYILKKKISDKPQDMAMSKAEYIAVEVAQLLNNEDVDKNWYDKILYEGQIKKTDKYISLNAFVRATRVFVNTLFKNGLFDSDWQNLEETKVISQKVSELVSAIWMAVYEKWPKLAEASYEDKQIIQGSIGYTAIIRTLVKFLRERHQMDYEQVKDFVVKTVLSFNVDESNWFKGGVYSKYSSESGYKYVSDELYNSVSKHDN